MSIPQTGEGHRMSVMDIVQVMKHLPHRYPFLLIDRVTELVHGERIVAIKNVTINEPFFPGHFPHVPVMPGVLIVEAMAQASALLSLKSSGQAANDDHVFYLVGVDGARFKRPVTAGDQLVIHSKIITQKRGMVKYSAQALVDGKVASEAELLCTVRPVDAPAA
jgi:3-hydroxyacyl-[acyl-carrier-protein] dehydratase